MSVRSIGVVASRLRTDSFGFNVLFLLEDAPFLSYPLEAKAAAGRKLVPSGVVRPLRSRSRGVPVPGYVSSLQADARMPV